jgi:trans-aconitate 2-methyltransferase
MAWDPDRYHQFEKERQAPFEDLMRLIKVRPDLRLADLGCGTGELTRRLGDSLPGSDAIGIDSSPQMLERAAVFVRPGVSFQCQRIEDFTGDWDLIFSHAALQWVPGHEKLIPRLLSLLRPGGQLAVQVPNNGGHFSQAHMAEVASREPYRSALGGWSQSWPTLPIDAYAKMLYDQGALELTVFEKVYPHVLADADAVVDWVSGTALLPYMERLPDDLKGRFKDKYRAGMRAHFPGSPVFFSFRRILFQATLA